MRRRALKALGVLLLLGVVGLLVVISGVIPIKASSGHWAITSWLLEFTKDRSIATHSIGLKAPSLTEPWLVLKGAGHYETGCKPCHGSPELKTPWLAIGALPPPPYLAPIIPKRDPEALFYAVKHGIKFTGMPAWPVEHRDDEVWAVVAFLLELPKLDAVSYRRLVFGEPHTDHEAHVPHVVAQRCARCHGEDGLGRGSPAFPRLAGQKPEAFFRAMEAYARDDRHSGMMGMIAADLRPEQWNELADYYAALAGDGEPLRPFDQKLVEAGEQIAMQGVPDKGVPSCMDCHGPGPHRRNAAYPNLAGQHAEYLQLQLELFTTDRRGGSRYAHLMDDVAHRLTPQQIREVAEYYESLRGSSQTSER